MKALLFALTFIALGDLAVNHGEGMHQLVVAIRGSFAWLAHVGDGSVFTR